MFKLHRFTCNFIASLLFLFCGATDVVGTIAPFGVPLGAPLDKKQVKIVKQRSHATAKEIMSHLAITPPNAQPLFHHYEAMVTAKSMRVASITARGNKSNYCQKRLKYLKNILFSKYGKWVSQYIGNRFFHFFSQSLGEKPSKAETEKKISHYTTRRDRPSIWQNDEVLIFASCHKKAIEITYIDFKTYMQNAHEEWAEMTVPKVDPRAF